jgi:hypothetical protein
VVRTDEVTGNLGDEARRPVNIAGGDVDICVLDPRPCLLCSCKPSAKGRVYHLCLPQRSEGSVRVGHMLGRAGLLQPSKLDPRNRKVGHEVLHPAEGTLHHLGTVVFRQVL